MFTPPPANQRDDNFQTFIPKFLTTDEAIPIELKLRKISIKVGEHNVEMDGTTVQTTIKGLKQSLISRIDVHLGFSALRREVSFWFTLGMAILYLQPTLLTRSASS